MQHESTADQSVTLPFVPYPAIANHGTIGDRRTAALVAADGTIDWLCLPDYDGDVVFGALLDARRGGFWRLGPRARLAGRQRYADRNVAVITSWYTPEWEAELTDLMALPKHPPGQDEVAACSRIVLRRLRAIRGAVPTAMYLRARSNFTAAAVATQEDAGAVLHIGEQHVGVWASRPLTVTDGSDIAFGTTLEAGDEILVALALGEKPTAWSPKRFADERDRTMSYWHGWWESVKCPALRQEMVRRSALTIHLLSYEPSGSQVAAPTTSLPEHIGGTRNYDYRFAWVRDASLSLALLAILGRTDAAGDYLDWLAGLGSSTASPLQVMYGIDGRTDLEQRERRDLHGYRDSLPVRFGNHAFRQRQLDSFGYLADCAWLYLEHGGHWRTEHWRLIERAATYTATHWREPDSSIWELTHQAQYLSSKVMSWVALDRAIKIARRTGAAHKRDAGKALAAWQTEMTAIRKEVLTRGWSERMGAFRQHYDAEDLDASALLIPLMGFLPPDDLRVRSTVRRIEEQLVINGFVHRFAPTSTTGEPGEPLPEFEGAFLPCTFWLATTYVKLGRIDDAEAILSACEDVAGALGTFAEEVDARDRSFLGNTPLLFAQAEYARAALALAHSRQATSAGSGEDPSSPSEQ